METERKRQTIPNPRKGANIFSIVTFSYTIPTFIKGFKKDLQEEDIPEHLEEHSSAKLGNLLDAAWEMELKTQKHPSLWRAIRKIFWLPFCLLGLVLLVSELVIKISQPIALSQLITYYTESEKTISKGWALFYASVIVSASFITVLDGHLYMLGLLHFGMKMRVALCSVIYRKSLRLSKSVLGGTTIGQMVNLLSNDVSRCDRAINHSHHIWVVPLETILITGLLYYFLGIVSTIGVFFLILFIPLEMYLGKKTSVLRLKTALKSDERVRLMNEIVCGIQVIKMYTWERSFAKLVAAVRKLEIKYVGATSYIRGLLLAFTIFTPSFAVFLTVLTYVLLGNVPQAQYVFVVSAFYNILKQCLTKHFPRAITEIAEIRVSISRIQKFLLYDEVQPQNNRLMKHLDVHDFMHKEKDLVNGSVKPYKPQSTKVVLKNVSAKWIATYPENTLEKISFTAHATHILALIGPVGSGKTSILHVILKELPISGGHLQVDGVISYASQEPWLFAGTIKQNILFGQAMIPDRYQKVLQVCALQQDLVLLPYGDQTLVGERGVTLSGGQRARINLARAVYKEADIYLLDDPLSAVDTHVGKQLFEECIAGFLKNKCTILVTHQLQYLQNVDNILLVESGKIVTSGTYHEIQNSGEKFAEQLMHKSAEAELQNSTESRKPEKSGINRNEAQAEVKEHRSTGYVSGDVYMSYLRAAGPLYVSVVILSLFVITQASVNLTDYFLTYWVNMEQDKANNADLKIPSDSNMLGLSRDTCLYIYSVVVATTFILALIRTMSFYKYCMIASKRLHNNMFVNIVYAPMRFFHTNSSGRILNRFSKDMGSIDEVMPMVTIDFLQCALAIAGVTVMISLVNPWLLLVTLVIITLFALMRIVYIRTSRSVKRLEGIARSPVFAHISASLQGLTTIRAFGTQGILQKEFDDHQDLHSAVWDIWLTCSRAFGFWLDMVCVGYIAIVTFSFFAGDDEYGGNVGLAITQAMSLTGTFQWGMRQWAELENQMTSVERVVEYTNLEQEHSPSEVTPPKEWPASGSISFKNVSLRYSLVDPYVLKSIWFDIRSNEKIGVVGRTGAGKSSLISAVFQLAKTEGVIEIDGVDVTKIPLDILRSKISIIPQEPVLFSGSLRKNLDPFDEYPDADLWSALEEVELKKVVTELPAGLHSKVSEGGSNFSVGQRQLVCLARAVIRKNKVLVLDEATANVDPQTDILIQKTIRKKFANCTVLTIAHRLHTIMDSDKILVMDAGEVAEFDHPYLLLQSENSLFYKLVQQTGPAMAENLAQIAEQNYRGS